MIKLSNTAVVAATVIASTVAIAAAPERQGKEVVEQVCAECHATGKDGAPKIGDRDAWLQRAKKGLAATNTNAIRGFRKMPAHGGDSAISDMEISRAIFFMMSGQEGNFKQSLSAPIARSGKEIVAAKCSDCHSTGKEGAPRIGHVSDWTPRLKDGIDAMVANAIHGHNQKMPARGGMPNLSDAEVKLAVEYMSTKQGN